MCLKAALAAAAAAKAAGDGNNVNLTNSNLQSTCQEVEFASPAPYSSLVTTSKQKNPHTTTNTFEKKPFTAPTTSLTKMMLSACPPVRPTAPSPLLLESDFAPVSISYSPPPLAYSPCPSYVRVAVVEKPVARRISIGSASTSTTSTVSTSSSSSNSTVRFASSPPLIHQYEVEYTDHDKPSLWYSKSDIHALQEEEKLSIKSYVQDQDPAYVTSLLKIWSTPMEQPEVLSRLVQPIQDTPLRGLEKHSLKSMKARRGVVLKKVLQAQQDFRNWAEDPQERALLLKEECMPLSRTSARFARAMALGDHAVVMKAQQLGTT